KKRLHVSNAISGSGPAAADHFRDVIWDQCPVIVHLAQRPHHLVHIHVTVIHEGLDEMGQRCIHITEVDFEDFAAAAKVMNGLQHVFPHEFAALEPSATAKAHSYIGTVSDLEGSLVALKIAEDTAWNAAQFGHGRVVGMNADSYACLLCHGRNSLDEIRVVIPNLLLRVDAPVRKGSFENLLIPVAGIGLRQVETTR